ncbi:MAG: type II secretion system F family protein [Blastocatellia bacterium]
MEILGIIFVSLTLIFLTLAVYFYVSRDLERYHRRVEERLQKLIDERGPAVVSQRDIQELKQELLSDIPAFHQLLLRFEVFNQLQAILRQAEFANITVYKFVVSSLIGGFAVASIAVAFQRSFFVWLVSLIVVSLLPLFFVLNRRRRRFRQFLEQLPDALEMVVRSLQAGHSFSSALQAIATEMPDPVAREFGKAYEEQNLGLSMKVALENLAERVPIMDLKLCVTAILIQREVGGNLSEVLANIGHTIRERFRIQGEIRVKTAQARLSGYIVSALPFILFFWINLANPKYLQSLYDHPMGVYILGAGIVMQIIGWLIIRRVVKIEI